MALLIACGGGGDDKADNMGVKISAVPTRDTSALSDFATLTPAPTLMAPAVSPTTSPPAPSNTPVPPASQAQTSAATATPLPPAPAPAVATPMLTVNGTPGPNDTFTYGAGPSGGTAGCTGQVPPGSGQQTMVFNGQAPPPGGLPQGGPPPQGGPAGQVFTTGAGGDPLAGLAAFLNVSTTQLQSELSQKGATQASIAARHGKSRDQLKAFLIEQTRKTTSEAVAKGQMTQAQATQAVSQFTASVDQVIDGSGCGPVTFGSGPAR